MNKFDKINPIIDLPIGKWFVVCSLVDADPCVFLKVNENIHLYYPLDASMIDENYYEYFSNSFMTWTARFLDCEEDTSEQILISGNICAGNSRCNCNKCQEYDKLYGKRNV